MYNTNRKKEEWFDNNDRSLNCEAICWTLYNGHEPWMSKCMSECIPFVNEKFKLIEKE